MRIKYFIAAAAMLSALCGQSQNATPTEHQPLTCSGAIPKDFVTSSAEKYRKESAKITAAGKKKKEAGTRKRFVLESNFVLDDLLQSGKVLFNDEVSLYLADVLRQVEQAQPMPGQTKLKAYALRSPGVNAFATDRGEVFVTLGMLAQLENEAQLAFILAHELAHIEQKHSLALYLKSDKIDRSSSNRRVLKNTVMDDQTLAKCAFSKDQETDADRLGLTRFFKTNYRSASLPTVCDVLKYANLPFDDQPFDRELLQSEHFRLPESLWLEKIKAIEGEDENEDDRHSTHPNLKKRREALVKSLQSANDAGKSDYLVGQERFEKTRELARLELPMYYLRNDDFSNAIYSASLLLRERPEDVFLKKCILKALYMDAKFKNDGDYKYDGDYEKTEGESQQVHHFLEKLPGREAIIVALHVGWKLHREHPKDSEIEAICDDLLVELSRKFDDLSDFSNAAPEPKTDTKTEPENGIGTGSKYDKIRRKNAQPGSPDYWKLAFVGWLGAGSDFEKAFADGKKRYENRRERDKFYESEAGQKKLTKSLRRERKKGLRLGIGKIAVVNPFYLKLDPSDDNPIEFIPTEQGQDNFRDLIREIGQTADLDVEVLDVCNLKEKQTEVFNDIRFLNDWFAEQVQHYELSLTPGYEQARVEAIAKKYGTDYFLWTGVLSLSGKKTLHYAILYDVKNGRRQVLKFDAFKRRDSDTLLKAHLYDTFIQIQRK